MQDIKKLEKMLNDMPSKIERNINSRHKVCGINGILSVAQSENRTAEFISIIEKNKIIEFDDFLTMVFKDRNVEIVDNNVDEYDD